jgi:hypothetical protein
MLEYSLSTKQLTQMINSMSSKVCDTSDIEEVYNKLIRRKNAQ